MYDLPYHKERNREVIQEFVLDYPFAVLTGCDACGDPVATQVPVFMKQLNGSILLCGHIMRGTDHHEVLMKNENVLVVFITRKAIRGFLRIFRSAEKAGAELQRKWNGGSRKFFRRATEVHCDADRARCAFRVAWRTRLPIPKNFRSIAMKSLKTTALIALLSCIQAEWAYAQIERFVATSGTDSGNTCTNHDDPCLTITHAVELATSNDIIHIAPGIYTEPEGIEIRKSLTLEGAGKDNITIIQAGQSPGEANSRVIDIEGDIAVAITSLTIRNGGGPDLFGEGGGIRSRQASLQLESVGFTENLAVSDGGGLSLRAGSASLSDVTFRANQSSGGGGGVVSRDQTGLSMSNVEFVENSSAFSGGGMFLVASASFGSYSLNNVTFRENEGGNGGGVRLTGGGTGSLLTMSNTTFIENTATSQGGGMFINNIVSSVLMNGVLFERNQAGQGGGGLYSMGGSAIELEDAVLRKNETSGQGGGIYVDGGRVFLRCIPVLTHLGGKSEGTSMTFRQSPVSSEGCGQFEENHAGQHGGAIAVESGGRLVIERSLINVNSADGLGSVAFVRNPDSELLIEGAFVWGNHGSSRLFQLEDRSLTSIDWSTIAGNPDPDHTVQVFRMLNSSEHTDTTRLRVRGSIIWEPGAVMINRTGPTFPEARCMIGHLNLSGSNFSSDSLFYSQVDPGLQDPEGGNLRLQDDSLAVDYCSTADANHVPGDDIFGNPRGVPHPAEPPLFPPLTYNPGNGDFDLGAHELQPLPDDMFSDRFEIAQ
jgi:predicted outer membrane repeat protein